MNTMQVDDIGYDLRALAKLEQLQIDHALLSHHDKPCSAPSRSDQDYNCWPQRLLNGLPASLESLKLVGSVPWKRVRAFFAGLPE